MDSETYIKIYMIFMQILAVEALIVWIMFSFGAPWYKYQAGWTIWGLLGSITLILSVFVLRVIFGEFPFRRELATITLLLLPIALGSVGISIYCTRRKQIQIKKLAEFEKAVKEGEK